MKENQKRDTIHTQPVHLVSEISQLSRDFPAQNFQGFFNLIILLLGVNLFRLIAENVLKYGLIIQPPWAHFSLDDIKCTLKISFTLLLNIGFSYSMKRASFLIHSFNLLVGILSPSIIVWTSSANPIIGMLLLLLSLTTFLKLFSFLCFLNEYGMFNPSQDISNLDTHFIYFLFSPTLCFQLSYPQSVREGPSKLYIAKRTIGLFSTFVAMYMIFYQFTYPTLLNSLRPIEERNIILIIERVFKLSFSSIILWLLGFFALFHCWLNILAELLNFSDRNFYQDWWNARSIEEYWRNWNLPVHNWLKRHIYKPLRIYRFSNTFSSAVVFLFSALAHEYIISIPLKVFHSWAFIAMVLQLPLAQISRAYMKKYPHSTFGNMLFWIVFCVVGQPVGILLYYYSFSQTNQKIGFWPFR
jgi:diacylglycerol O-acyltransferase 1